MSSLGNRRPEPVSLYTISGKGRKPSGFSPANHRQKYLPSSGETRQGHSRVFSETAVPSSLQTGLSNGFSTRGDIGEPNGLGIVGTDAYPPDRQLEPNRNWFWNGLTRNTSLNHANRHANELEALNEDGPATISFAQRVAREEVIEEERSIDLRSPTAAAFDVKNSASVGLTRARSITQMHDLREQMQDLKGKISTLKQRAKEDNLRRRSMQSLRTPSPFTAAEQWYNGTPSPEDKGGEPVYRSGLVDEAQEPRNPEGRSRNVPEDSGHASPVELVTKDHHEILDDEVIPGEDPLDELREENHDAELEVERIDGLPSQKERLLLVDEPLAGGVIPDHTDAAVVEEDFVVESESREDSLYGDQDYHETSTSPIITKHEDREDAFDYEHYILTSAMGSYTGIGVRRSSSMRKRSNSLTSDSSAETTKPRNSMGDDVRNRDTHLMNGRHGRQDSIDSISTTNTFATANEVNDSDSNSSQDDRTPRKPPTPSYHPEPPRTHKPNPSNESLPDHFQTNSLQNHNRKTHIVSAQKGYTNHTFPITKTPPPPLPDLLTLLSSHPSWQSGPLPLSLGDRDKELVERLVKSLANVCSQVHRLGAEGGGESNGNSEHELRVFRRKMDAARRVLDGEMNGEVF